MDTSDERLHVAGGGDEHVATQVVIAAREDDAGAETASVSVATAAGWAPLESEERFRALVEATGQLVWTTPPDGLVVDMPLWRAYTGQSRAQVRGWGWLDAVHPDDRAAVRRGWSAAVADRTPFEVEYRLRRHDGVYRYFLARATPVLGPEGTLREWVGVHTDLTERKRVEEDQVRQLERERALRAAVSRQAQQLEAVFASMSDAVFVYDDTGTITGINPAGKALLGVDTEPEHITRSPEERSIRYALRDENGNPLAVDESPMRRILRGEMLTGDKAVDIQMETLDGRLLQLSYAGAPVRDGDGRITGAVGVCRDVTERRRLEQEARASAHEAAERAGQLEAIYESIADGVLVFDNEGRLLKSNSAGRALIASYAPDGYYDLPAAERGQLLCMENEAGEVIPVEELPLARIAHGEVLTAERSVDILIPTLDGGRIHVNVSGAPFRNADGKLVGTVCIFRDVSVQQQLQQRTHDALNALLEIAEALVQADSSENGGKSSEPDPNATGHAKPHPMAQKQVELTRRMLGCKRISITSVEGESELQRAVAVTGLTAAQQRLWDAEHATDTRLDDGVSPEIAARLRAGDLVTLDLSQPPYRDQPNPYGVRDLLIAPMQIGDQLMGFMAVDYGGEAHTFTADEKALAKAVAQLAAVVLERERLQHEREEARASALALREANRRMDEFMGIASHELRTPLTVVKANLQIFSRHLNRTTGLSQAVGAPGQAMLKRMERQVERLDRLVSDLLDDSRIQEGKLELRMERCDLATIVREAVEEQRLAHDGRAIRLHVGGTKSPLWVRGDADRLGQVVTNYLTNALKYSSETEPVTVRMERHGVRVKVAVEDRGPGLTEKQRARIWQRFYRAPGIEVQSGSGVGLGLGLHITRTIIERHRGKVGVESEPGTGSTFWFELPVDTTPSPSGV